MTPQKTILGINAPHGTCTDKKCPFHGSLSVRGRMFSGTVVGQDVHNTATGEWTRKRYVPKFERFENRKTRLRVHNPPCIGAKKGDVVIITECRPLSKTKKFVILQKKGEDVRYYAKLEALQEEEARQKGE